VRGLGKVYKRDKSPFLWIKYYDASGKRCRESTGVADKHIAQQILVKRVAYASAIRSGLKPAHIVTYQDFGKEFLAHYKARYPYQTFKSHRSVVNEFGRYLAIVGLTTLSEITPAVIDRYITYRRDNKKNRANTCNNHLKNLHTQFAYAVTAGYIANNPAKGCAKVAVNDAKPKGALSRQELQQLLTVAKQDYPHYYPIFYTFLHTGLRYTEVISLKWADADFKSKVLWIMKPKGRKKPDYVSIHDGLINTLMAIPRHSDYIFTNEQGKPFVERSRKIIRRLQKILKKAKIASISTLHELRHTHCSHLFSLGFSSREVQRQMRHHDLRITENYAHVFNPEYAEKIKLLETLDKSDT
jgi:integrase/recombinase XerD